MFRSITRAIGAGVVAGVIFTSNGCGLLDPSSYGPQRFEVTQRDESLTPAGYVELGMPSINREWNVAEKRQALDVLVKLAVDRPTQLPHFDGPGAQVVAKLRADLDAALKPSSLPAEVRARQLTPSLAYEVVLLEVYLRAHFRTGMYDDEIVLFTTRLLRTSVVALDVQTQAMNAGYPMLYTDPSAEVRQMREGLKALCVNSSKLTSAVDFFGAAARQRLSGELLAVFPRLLPEVDSLTRQEIRVALQEAQKREPESSTRSNLDRLIATTTGAVAASPIDAALQKRPRTAAGAAWATRTFDKLDLAADFPGVPVVRDTAFSFDGHAGSFATAWTQTNDNIRFSIVRVNAPVVPSGSNSNVPAAPTLDQAVARFDPKLIASKTDLRHGKTFPSREVTYRDDAVGVYRFILVGDDTIELAVEMPSGTDVAVVRKHADRFFNTVKINPPAPKRDEPQRSTI
jgi:hypothetical protein